MSYDPCSFSRDNRLLHEGSCATSVSSLRAGMDTADSDITRPLRPSTMPASGVLHFLPKGFFPPAHCFFSEEATAQGKRWQLHWQHRTEHVSITAAFKPARNHHRIQVWGHKFLSLKMHRACRRTQECGQYCYCSHLWTDLLSWNVLEPPSWPPAKLI